MIIIMIKITMIVFINKIVKKNLKLMTIMISNNNNGNRI